LLQCTIDVHDGDPLAPHLLVFSYYNDLILTLVIGFPVTFVGEAGKVCFITLQGKSAPSQMTVNDSNALQA
jgi:hypothetical protein